MKQFQFDYKNNDNLVSYLKRIKQWCQTTVVSNVLFQIYTESLDKEMLNGICDTIKKEMPDALYMGCSTNGNIIMGDKSDDSVSIVCTAYEYPSTKIMVLQYHLDAESAFDVACDLNKHVRTNSWVKSIMTFTTMRGMSMTEYCEELGMLPKSVVFCGGGAFSGDINNNAAVVFSSNGEVSDHAAVFLLTGGDDYYVEALHVTGWKPLGRHLLVTKAKGEILYELDGKPAYETYSRYLDIRNDDDFFFNTLEFPFLYELNGQDILRAPIDSGDDGSLTMTADIAENVKARIAYGDPQTILQSVHDAAYSFQPFIPEAITVFSCAGRRTFWGDDEIGNETYPFQSLAPTSGFYTSGEFLRTGDYVNQHNVTLVIEAQREGGIEGKTMAPVDTSNDGFSGKVSMIKRLASFIQAATEELEQANKKLETMAITDGLTGLYNRAEIQNRITDNARENGIGAHGIMNTGASLIMMDIDDFKTVNDNYGHKEGDIVLMGLADMLKETVGKDAPDASIGRWGGEEFMVLLPTSNLEKATMISENIRKHFNEIEFELAGHRTISLGVTEMIAGEDADLACMRVDGALYEAKRSGKDRVVQA
ncbi:MAG: diguanylate cyclase [Eubacterium sp.]|nr:diguanylate cyclase [Eubacterium sp.]